MFKSFSRILDVDPGFCPEGVLTARITLPSITYPGQRKLQFYQRLIDGLSRREGVQATAIVRDLPLTGTDPRIGVMVAGRPGDMRSSGYTIRYRIISQDYFKVMSIPLKRGQYFTNQDVRGAPVVAIINESAAQQIFPGQDPLGQVLITGGTYAPDKCIVVGVVGDVDFAGLNHPPEPEIYIHYQQLPDQFIQPVIGSMTVVLRATGDTPELVKTLKQQVATIDSGIPISSVLTMYEVLDNTVAPGRFSLLLLTIFAGLSLFLAATGIYGTVSYSVTQRRHEIGIRMALGTQRRDILKLIVGQSMFLVLIGLVIGLGAAFLFARVMSHLLFAVSPTDPETIILVGMLLISMALLASFIPAWRATKVDSLMAKFFKCE
jgi:putative ABC transport system permease protein